VVLACRPEYKLLKRQDLGDLTDRLEEEEEEEEEEKER
jgi:hypothetical protein